jgi:hypothetical protein
MPGFPLVGLRSKTSLGEFAKASSMKKLDAASWVPDEPERTVAAFISSIARKWA